MRALQRKWPEAEYITASSGGEALEIIDSGAQVDFAVVDLKLGWVTGAKVADYLKARQVPALIVTGTLDLSPKGFPALAKKPGLPGLIELIKASLLGTPSPLQRPSI